MVLVAGPRLQTLMVLMLSKGLVRVLFPFVHGRGMEKIPKDLILISLMKSTYIITTLLEMGRQSDLDLKMEVDTEIIMDLCI